MFPSPDVDGVLARAPRPKVVALPVAPRPRRRLWFVAFDGFRLVAEVVGWVAIAGLFLL